MKNIASVTFSQTAVLGRFKYLKRQSPRRNPLGRPQMFFMLSNCWNRPVCVVCRDPDSARDLEPTILGIKLLF